MRTPATIIRCLNAGPVAALAELGFSADGPLTFRRTLGNVHNVIECNLSDEGTQGAGWFVFELGARHHRVHELMGYRRLNKPAAGACTVHARVNRSDGDNDTWWRLTPGRELATAQHVAHRLRHTVEAWFSLANDLGALNERLKGKHDEFWCQDSLAPAAIAMALGQVELGRERLDAQLKQIHAWREHRLDRYRRNDPYGTAVLETAHFMTTGKRTKRFRINQYEWDQVRY